MKTVFGIGSPGKKKQSGIVYIDKQNGNRYVQTKHPFGNEWLLLNDDSSSVPSSSIVYGTEMPSFTQKFTLTESDISSLDFSYSYPIGNLAPTDGSLTDFPVNSSGLTFVTSIYSRMTGDAITVSEIDNIIFTVGSNINNYYSGTWEISTTDIATIGSFCKWQSTYGTPANFMWNLPHNGSDIPLGIYPTWSSAPLTPAGTNTLSIWVTYIFVPYSN